MMGRLRSGELWQLSRIDLHHAVVVVLPAVVSVLLLPDSVYAAPDASRPMATRVPRKKAA